MHLFYPRYGLATTTRYGCTTVVPPRSHQHRSSYSTFGVVRLFTPSFHFPTFHTCPSVSARYHQHHSCSIHGVISPTSWLCHLRCGSNTTFLMWNSASVDSLLTKTTLFSIVGSVLPSPRLFHLRCGHGSSHFGVTLLFQLIITNVAVVSSME